MNHHRWNLELGIIVFCLMVIFHHFQNKGKNHENFDVFEVSSPFFKINLRKCQILIGH
jgi:hypothetical protein